MKNQPVEVAKIVGEKINLVTKVRRPFKPYFAAVWKAEKMTCSHRHKTRKAAERCIPILERLRKDLLLFRRVSKYIPTTPLTEPNHNYVEPNYNYAEGM